MGLNYNVWLPHLKFTLQTIAITYPARPNEYLERNIMILFKICRYFSFRTIWKNFLELLDKYPVTVFKFKNVIYEMGSFIFNKINEQLEKPVEDFYDSLEKYYDEYKPKEIRNREIIKTRKRYIQFASALLITLGIVYFYKK